jgi:glycosyltransferase involved in cell wall biosynthesis
MRILLVNDYPLEADGGTEGHIFSLYNALQEYGHTPFVLTGQFRGQPYQSSNNYFRIPDFNAPPLRKRPLKNLRNNYGAIKTACRIIADIKPDIIHIHNLLNPFSLGALRRLAPVVKSNHDCRPFCAKPPEQVASRLVGNSSDFCSRLFGFGCFGPCYIRPHKTPRDLIQAWSYFPHNYFALKEVLQCERIVVYSNYLKSLALRRLHNPDKVQIVHHFQDFRVIKPDEQVFPNTRRLLFVGRLCYEKGLYHLLNAIKKVPLDFETLIVGDGPIRPTLHTSIRTWGLKNVQLLGHVSHKELTHWYKKASAVVFPSIGSEGCPLIGIEALAHGKPLVAFDVGGVNEWLIDGKTGFLASRGNISELAERIHFLLSDRELAKQMGRAGIKLVNQKFQKHLHVSRLLEIYKEAILSRQTSQPAMQETNRRRLLPHS